MTKIKILRTGLIILTSVLLLLGAEILTYNTIAKSQLKSRLLTPPLGGNSYDTIYVSSYYNAGCGGSPLIVENHDLESIKKLIGTVYFGAIIVDNNHIGHLYKGSLDKAKIMKYNTYIIHQDYWSLYDMFSAWQTEEIEEKRFKETKDVKYRWMLFSWFEVDHYFETHGNCSN